MNKKPKRPAKHSDVLKRVREAINNNQYLDTVHALERQSQRLVSRPEYLYVLRKSGYHEKRKDQFIEAFNAWNYAIRGKTIDERELRVIVSFDPSGLLIITVIDLEV